MSAPRLHLGGKGQPPQRESVVSSVSELWRLCQLSRRHKGDCSPTESATGQSGGKHQKAVPLPGWAISDKWSEEGELSSLLLGIALGMSTFCCTSRQKPNQIRKD